MLAKKLEVENILGVEKLVIEPGAVTIIEGRNGSGKSSILDAVRAVLRGGHDPSLIHDGAEEGRIRLTLEDGTVLLKRVTKERSSLDVTVPEHGKISRAQAYVDSQVDELGIDPLEILSCPESKLAGYLAEAMPVKADPAVLESIIGRPPVARELNDPLAFIATERQRLYDERTGTNRTLKDKRTMAAQLRETLPAAEDVPADPAGLREEKKKLEDRRDDEILNAGARRIAAIDVVDATLGDLNDAEEKKENDEVERIRRETDARIEEVRALGRKRASEREEQARGLRADSYEAEKAEVEAARAAVEAPLAELSEKITKAEALATEHARASKTREIIATSEKDAARAEASSKALSHAIDELDALKVSLLEKLPIKGLEIREGQVLVDGHVWKRANRARRIDIALKLAQLRAGPLGLIVIDNAEGVGPEEFPEWERAAAAEGMQVFLARATRGDLSVRTVAATEAAAS